MPRHLESPALRPGLVATLLASLLVGCEPVEDAFNVANVGDVGASTISGALVATDGSPLVIDARSTVTVETRVPEGEWQEVLWLQVRDRGTALIDSVLVADNSGSQEGQLEIMQDALKQLAHHVLARGHDDRLGLVRVSTGSRVVRELSPEEDDFDSGVDELFVANGWTALWDGVRMANETLERGAVVVGPGEACADPASRSVILFTDGRDNNSADEKSDNYSDGIDTTLEDVLALEVNDVRTSMYVVGIGEQADAEALTALAEQTGGEYRSLSSYNGLEGALRSAAAQLEEQVPVCFQPVDCTHTEARVTIDDRSGVLYERVFTIPPTCG